VTRELSPVEIQDYKSPAILDIITAPAP
jgi:hypothetical protein